MFYGLNDILFYGFFNGVMTTAFLPFKIFAMMCAVFLAMLPFIIGYLFIKEFKK